MNKSEQLGELFAAMSKAQGEMKPAVMDSKNPHFQSKFASLTAVKDSYQAALSKHQLSIQQFVEFQENAYTIETILGHSSGQWISSTLRLILNKQDMQGLGSAVTYSRRYAISAILGVVDTEDDDANASVAPKKAYAPPSSPKNEAPPSDAQVKRMFALAKERGVAVDSDLKNLLKRAYGIESTKNLKRWMMDEIYQLLENPATNSESMMAYAEKVNKQKETQAWANNTQPA